MIHADSKSHFNKKEVKKMRKSKGGGGQVPFAVSDHEFVKSSWSRNNPKTCVTVAVTSRGVAVRDSKDPAKGTQFYTNAEWRAFLRGVKGGEFDLR